MQENLTTFPCSVPDFFYVLSKISLHFIHVVTKFHSIFKPGSTELFGLPLFKWFHVLNGVKHAWMDPFEGANQLGVSIPNYKVFAMFAMKMFKTKIVYDNHLNSMKIFWN